jgi:hypothetical protein
MTTVIVFSDHLDVAKLGDRNEYVTPVDHWGARRLIGAAIQQSRDRQSVTCVSL